MELLDPYKGCIVAKARAANLSQPRDRGRTEGTEREVVGCGVCIRWEYAIFKLI